MQNYEKYLRPAKYSDSTLWLLRSEEEGDAYGEGGEVDGRRIFQHLHRGVTDVDAERIVIREGSEEVESDRTAVEVLGKVFASVTCRVIVDSLDGGVGIEVEDRPHAPFQ